MTALLIFIILGSAPLVALLATGAIILYSNHQADQQLKEHLDGQPKTKTPQTS